MWIIHNAMQNVEERASLGRALDALVVAAVVPHVADKLNLTVEVVGQNLRDAVLAEVREFSVSGHPGILPELERHAHEHVAELRRLLAGEAVGDFEFVRRQAHHRAEQRFPLEAVLHAYRCGHRVLSQWIREGAIAVRPRSVDLAVSAVADFAIEYTNAISTIATAEYVAQTRVLAETEGDRRTELLRILLSGYDESDRRVAWLLKRAGYLDQRQSFCVAVVQSADPREMESPERVQRIVESIGGAVAPLRLRSLVGVRDNFVTAVFSDVRRASGWTAARAALAERVRPHLLMLGPAVLVGLSNDQPSTACIPKGLHEATVALDFATVSDRVMAFSQLTMRRLLVHRGDDAVQAALPGWFAAFRDADAKAAGALIRTLRALADADMNVQAAARAVGLHPNTLYARLTRIQDLTGLDARRYHDLTELLLAVDCTRAGA